MAARIRVDTYSLVALSEETGLTIGANPVDSDTGLVELSISMLGPRRAKLTFYTRITEDRMPPDIPLDPDD